MSPLATLRAAGLTVRLDGDALRVGPRERLTPELRVLVAEHKAALLEALALEVRREVDAEAPALEAAEAAEERAGIMEFDGGLSRAEAERRAGIVWRLCTACRHDLPATTCARDRDRSDRANPRLCALFEANADPALCARAGSGSTGRAGESKTT